MERLLTTTIPHLSGTPAYAITLLTQETPDDPHTEPAAVPVAREESSAKLDAQGGACRFRVCPIMPSRADCPHSQELPSSQPWRGYSFVVTWSRPSPGRSMWHIDQAIRASLLATAATTTLNGLLLRSWFVQLHRDEPLTYLTTP
jgi:hypothetical protein